MARPLFQSPTISERSEESMNEGRQVREDLCHYRWTLPWRSGSEGWGGVRYFVLSAFLGVL
ncbi:hypothetical protein GCM10027567_16170 [Spongiibacter taiwanensis]